MIRPTTRYATSDDLSIAYQVFGNGPLDLVVVPGFVTNVEFCWEFAPQSEFYERLASFARVIIFDKRGTGLSDPFDRAPTFEERMDDVRAVMDAVESERAALFGISEGGPMCLLFAAAYPTKVSALVLHGAMARSTEAPDYPWAPPADALRQSTKEFIAPLWGTGATVEIFSPSLADDPRFVELTGRQERLGATPKMARKIFEMFADLDVRSVLPSIRVPTLVMHRRGDRAVNVRVGRWLAEHLPEARFVELKGIDHVPWVGDTDEVLGEIQEFLTGAREVPDPDRILCTVAFTDIVGSTERAAALGDRRWRDLLATHDEIVRRELERHRGREIDTAGDGFLSIFDGPARAIRCMRATGQRLREVGIEIRAGLHAGEVETAGDKVRGIAVHIAARVASMATGGEVLVSSTVKDLVAGSGVRFADRGAHVLKGVPDEWRIFAVED